MVRSVTAGLLLIGVLVLAGCSRDETPTPVVAPEVTVQTGVIELTPEVVSVSPQGGGGSEGSAPPNATVTGPGIAGLLKVLEPGTEVQALGMLRLYAAPEPTAATLDEYVAGATFTIIASPDDLGPYPVELNGVRWYRVRAADGLVGWVIADGIVDASAVE